MLLEVNQITPESPQQVKQFLQIDEAVLYLGPANEKFGNIQRERWIILTDKGRFLVMQPTSSIKQNHTIRSAPLLSKHHANAIKISPHVVLSDGENNTFTSHGAKRKSFMTIQVFSY